MIICGPKCSLCGIIVSIWGMLQLAAMGIFYFVNSVALLEDIPLGEKFEDTKSFYTAAKSGYTVNAMNCWIAACLYLFTLLFAGHQFYMHSRSQN
uniref:Putative membrane-bound ribonuclease n=1 Tax=Triatoma infestans TaxID=30076 RepID=A0A023FB88_TRIIF